MEPEIKNNSSHKQFFIITGIIICVIIIAGLIYYKLNQQANNQEKYGEPEQAQIDNSSNILDLSSVKIGDKIGTMTVESIIPYSESSTPPLAENLPLSTSNVKIVFSGQATLSGEYTYEYSPLEGSYRLSFKVSNDRDKLPIIKDSEERKEVLCWFSNQGEALKLLGITKDVEKKGNATIIVKNYVINRYPSEVTDMFELMSAK